MSTGAQGSNRGCFRYCEYCGYCRYCGYRYGYCGYCGCREYSDTAVEIGRRV